MRYLRTCARNALCVAGLAVALSAAEHAGAAILVKTWNSATGTTVANIQSDLNSASPGSVFYITPGSNWTVNSTLNVPEGVSIIGSATGNDSTFVKNFASGPLMTVKSDVTLYGLVVTGTYVPAIAATDTHGSTPAQNPNTGPLVVAGSWANGAVDPNSDPVERMSWTRVNVHNAGDDAFVVAGPLTNCQFHFCKFDNNQKSGIHYKATAVSRNNVWNSIHFDDSGGVPTVDTTLYASILLESGEQDSMWTNCEWLQNGGPAFEQKTGSATPCSNLTIRGVIRDNGPAWLNRSGNAKSIVFTDCRIKHNQRIPTPGLSTSNIGLFHVESGSLSLEVRGGAGFFDNFRYFFTDVASTSGTKSRVTVSGGDAWGPFNFEAANRAYLVLSDLSLIRLERISGHDVKPTIKVQSGLALDPATGSIITFDSSGSY